MLLFLQSEQVSLEQYCHSVIACVTPLLLDYLNKHVPQLGGDGEVKHGDSSGSCRPLPVYIAICLQLLGAVVDLLKQLRRHTGTPQYSHRSSTLVRMHTTVSTDNVMQSQCKTKSSLLYLCAVMLNVYLGPLGCMQGIQNLESLASVLSQCLSKWRRFGTPTQPSCPQLQLVCWTTLHLATCLGKLLDIQGPYACSVRRCYMPWCIHTLRHGSNFTLPLPADCSPLCSWRSP